MRRKPAAATAAVLVLALAACGGSGGSGDDAQESGGKTVTLISHDSWAASKEVIAEFEKTSGYKLKVLEDGDAGQALNKAVLTKDHPQGDVLFGVDNTLLSRALDNQLFDPYEAEEAARIGEGFRVEGDAATPVTTGDVCVNYDKAYFEKEGLEPPNSFDDLVEPAYRNLLVTENAGTSSPGLGFLLGTAAEYGDDGWQDYWKKLRANGVKVVSGWEQAYNEEFSGSAGGKQAGGDRPLVVSYASSPPVEVIYADPQPEEAPTGVATGTCFRQIEYAGLLKNAANPEGGKALLDFLVSQTFQEDLPLNMFVNPVRSDAALPEAFTEHGAVAEDPRTLAPEKIAANRDEWIDRWTSLVVR
ncbi:thiamine ABC transporter substrate-binding protein [Streptomyces sp. NPDC005012]|uniref:thiamine ABC transporter substrate-binding protein n=1 Tax=Streptomyces sp. NPDC005012 TaxID=3154558 RepID=UPI0033A178F5